MRDPVAAELVDASKIHVTSAFTDKELVKAIPGARWDPDDKTWYTPLSWAACKQLRGMFGERLVVGPELTSWAWREYTERVQRVEALRQLQDTEGDPDLWPTQRVGVDFLSIAGQALLADEMGTGKTVQALRALRRLAVSMGNSDGDGGPVLVVCPNSVKRTWEKLASEWTPELDVRVVQGGAATRRKQIQAFVDEGADVLVINWESIRLHSRLAPYGSIRLKKCAECDRKNGDPDLKPSRCEVHPKELNEIEWWAVVADEAHHMKNPRAKQTRATWAVGHQQWCYRFALTGTPIANTPDDLWSILHFLHPHEWPAKTKYVDRYCLTSWNPFGGLDIAGLRPETKDEFYSIFDSRFLRRPLSLVLPFLPKVTVERRRAEMSAKQKKAYKSMRDHQIAILEEEDAMVATNPLTVLTRLLQFASAYAELDGDGHAILAEPSSKLDVLDAIIQDVGEPIVVFAESRQLLQLAEKRFEKPNRKLDYVSVHGEVSEAERQINVQRFATKQVPVCLVTLGAGGEGLDGLQHGARVEVWLQRSTSMLKNKQGEGRLRRGGQGADKILRIEVVTEDTVEEAWLDGILAAKEENFEDIVRDKQSLMKLLQEG